MENNTQNSVSGNEEVSIENKESEVKPAPEPITKKSSREEKSRKKDDKSVEQVLKALNSLDTPEEKLAAMCKKYTDIVDENRKLQLTAKQSEKRIGMLQREKEQLQTEHSKAVLTRSRLESLCRELQRQNKAVKDESLLKIREEEEKRKEVSAKFQTTLAEITSLMQQNNEKNSKLRADNLEMTKKFKAVCEQYELREQHVEKISKQMQLESQLSDAKLAKARMEMAAEKEALLREKQQLLLELTQYQAKCQELQTTEVTLRSQINLYTDKYDEFQNALSRSNEVFGGFKGEMEKMSKKICKLEKETSSWKQRWENSHQALLEMAADKQQRDSELALATRQLAQLQKLCRTLQGERAVLLAQVKGAEKQAGSGDCGQQHKAVAAGCKKGDNCEKFCDKPVSTPTTDSSTKTGSLTETSPNSPNHKMAPTKIAIAAPSTLEKTMAPNVAVEVAPNSTEEKVAPNDSLVVAPTTLEENISVNEAVVAAPTTLEENISVNEAVVAAPTTLEENISVNEAVVAAPTTLEENISVNEAVVAAPTTSEEKIQCATSVEVIEKSEQTVCMAEQQETAASILQKDTKPVGIEASEGELLEPSLDAKKILSEAAPSVITRNLELPKDEPDTVETKFVPSSATIQAIPVPVIKATTGFTNNTCFQPNNISFSINQQEFKNKSESTPPKNVVDTKFGVIKQTHLANDQQKISIDSVMTFTATEEKPTNFDQVKFPSNKPLKQSNGPALETKKGKEGAKKRKK